MMTLSYSDLPDNQLQNLPVQFKDALIQTL